MERSNLFEGYIFMDAVDMIGIFFFFHNTRTQTQHMLNKTHYERHE